MPHRFPAADAALLSRPPHSVGAPNGAARPESSPSLEADFARRLLAENRTLIRVTSLVSLALIAIRGAEQIVLGSLTESQVGQFAAVLGISIALAALAWGPWFGRLYLPCAQVLVPLRGSLIALTVAGVAARGQLEALMLLPVIVIGPFLVFGLGFRAASASAACTIVVYAIAAASFGLALPLIVRSCVLLLVVAGACGVVARTLEHSARNRFFETHAMTELAHRDALTGVKNRRVFDEHLDELWQRGAGARCALAVLLLDVDHFKAYNDRYGHQAGDAALRHVAQVLQALVTRSEDLIARYGGEEFAVLLYDADRVEVEKLADRMRKAVVALALEHRDSRVNVVSVSIGVAVVEPSLDRRPRGAVQLADEALYRAKTRGRNRVEVLDPTAHQALETGVFAKITGTHQ
jgi:diguanylate cyclase (GGDEF)-like protein